MNVDTNKKGKNTMEQYKEMIQETILLPSEEMDKRERDYKYLMELKTENLLFPFYTEAGLNGRLHYKLTDVHWGWDSPLSQIRGTFTGHWLSAAARMCQECQKPDLKVKADYIVSEIARCQNENGGGWAFSIPEKYMYAVKNGKHFWAPQYVCHKIMMGLLDMYLFTENTQAMEILAGCTDWFIGFTADIDRATMDMMMDNEETGGLMEFWGDLYAVTKEERHLNLMRQYERPKLTEPLLQGKDVLTNMHANTTIPEIHGCARAYEVTGEERYRNIVESYWDFAVTKRGRFATGGQTDGEMWTPMMRQSARLGEVNQEHCSVYNMVRLADYLYRWTGDTVYMDYIEQNIENGWKAQGFWEGRCLDTLCETEADSGLIAYFLPLAAGSSKKWGSKTDDFWCCHCTLVQANSRYREFVYYAGNKDFTVSRYVPSQVTADFNGVKTVIRQLETDLAGPCLIINDVSLGIESRPAYKHMTFSVTADTLVEYTLRFRIPWWAKDKIRIWINGEEVTYQEEASYAVINRIWQKDEIIVRIPKGITCIPLADEPETVAFMDGPVLLAGLVPEERMLIGDKEHPETLLAPHHERQWNQWMPFYKTVNQMRGFYLKPLKDIGKETYTIYFPIKKKK